MIIYIITNNVNNKVYIGQTIQKLYARRHGHLADSKRERIGRSKTKISNAINKYGFENFTFTEIYKATSIEELNFVERCFIKIYNSHNDKYGYNLLIGGHQNGSHNDETKKKLSIASKNASDKTKLEKGKHWNKGRSHSEESKKLIGKWGLNETNPNNKNVTAYSKEGFYIGTYINQRRAKEALNLSGFANISSCCHGKLKTAYGYIWKHN